MTTWSLTPRKRFHHVSPDMVISSNLSQSKVNSLWCHSSGWCLEAQSLGFTWIYIGQVPRSESNMPNPFNKIQRNSTRVYGVWSLDQFRRTRRHRVCSRPAGPSEMATGGVWLGTWSLMRLLGFMSLIAFTSLAKPQDTNQWQEARL